MKHFTPERYARLGNLISESAFLAAQDDWERAIALYKEQLRRIQHHLPASLQRMLESVYLHDAKVLDMWQGQVSRFTITLQPESTPEQLVVLAYSLTEPPLIERTVLPDALCSDAITWLYDELDVEKGKKQQTTDRRPAIVHDILLSNGWEIRLRFRDVAVTRPIAVIPSLATEGNRRATAG
jgi:hypothetical protein